MSLSGAGAVSASWTWSWPCGQLDLAVPAGIGAVTAAGDVTTVAAVVLGAGMIAACRRTGFPAVATTGTVPVTAFARSRR